MTFRRRTAAALAGLVLAASLAACGDSAEDRDGEVLSFPSTTGLADGTGTTAATSGGADSGDGGPGAGAADQGSGTDPGGGDTPADPSLPTGDGSWFPALDAGVPAGQFAPAYLRADRSGRIAVEIHVASGAEASSSAMAHVQDVLADVSGKPVDVVSGADPGGSTSWDAASLRAAADAGPLAQGDGTAVLRLLFVHGTFEGQDSVLGVAVRGDVAAVFMDRLAEAAGLLGDRSAIEASVITHEVGHLLGLVDLVLHTGRADPDHPGHSRNQGSVMYWAVESDLISSVLGARPPRDFDADDRADLAAIAGG